MTARDAETGLAVRARSGAHGEFLVVRLPVGEYQVTVEAAGANVTLRDNVSVGLGEVTEIEARVRASLTWARGRRWAAGCSESMGGAGGVVTQADVAELPTNGGQWRSLALTVPGANGAAEGDDAADEASFRGVAVTENSSRSDGASGDEGFSGMRAGAGIEEEEDAGADEVRDRSSGVGSGWGSVTDGGRRVRRMRSRRQGRGSSACWGRGTRRRMVRRCMGTGWVGW